MRVSPTRVFAISLALIVPLLGADSATARALPQPVESSSALEKDALVDVQGAWGSRAGRFGF